jgi:hypothetical protein
MQYGFQSWNTKLPGKYRDLLFGIGAEDFGHVEMLATMIRPARRRSAPRWTSSWPSTGGLPGSSPAEVPDHRRLFPVGGPVAGQVEWCPGRGRDGLRPDPSEEAQTWACGRSWRGGPRSGS